MTLSYAEDLYGRLTGPNPDPGFTPGERATILAVLAVELRSIAWSAHWRNVALELADAASRASFALDIDPGERLVAMEALAARGVLRSRVG